MRVFRIFVRNRILATSREDVRIQTYLPKFTPDTYRMHTDQIMHLRVCIRHRCTPIPFGMGYGRILYDNFWWSM